MMTETRTGVALGHASDTFVDTDGGGLEAGDALAIHEEDVEVGLEDEEGADIGLDLQARASIEPDVLESLLQDTGGSNTAKAQSKGSDFSLDDLLTESLETIAESAAVKANRKKLKDTRLSKAEREAVEAKIREWEMAREWTPKAQVAMFNRQQCDCGSHHSTFSGLFQRQQHRVSAIQRWVPANDIADTGLPKESKATTSHIHLCGDCAEAQGFGDCAGMNHVSVQHTLLRIKTEGGTH